MVGYVSDALVQQESDIKEWIYILGNRVHGISFIICVLLYCLLTHQIVNVYLIRLLKLKRIVMANETLCII